jgi:hypothetical protein
MPGKPATPDPDTEQMEIGAHRPSNLALLGVGKIEIYDFDLIEEHNLTRSVLLPGLGRQADWRQAG